MIIFRIQDKPNYDIYNYFYSTCTYLYLLVPILYNNSILYLYTAVFTAVLPILGPYCHLLDTTGLIRESLVNQIGMNGKELLIPFFSVLHLLSFLLCISYKNGIKTDLEGGSTVINDNLFES